MKTPKSRSMPMTAAMTRFVNTVELIRSRTEVDDLLRDLCEDYSLARETLARLKKERPRPGKKISEYSVLVSELEEEIINYLVNPGRGSTAG